MKFLFAVLLFLLFNWNCRKSTKNQAIDPRIVWEEKFIDTEIAVIKFDPVIAEGKVFIFRDILNNDLKETALMALDKQTGEKLWTWREVKRLSDLGNEIAYVFYRAWYFEGVLVGLAGQHLFGISAETGEKLWQTEFNDEIYGDEVLFEGKLYFTSDNFYADHRLKAYEVDPNTGIYNTLFDLAPFYDGYKIQAGGSIPYVNGQGEKCILTGVVHIKGADPAEDVKYNLLSFNIDNNEMEFNTELANKVGLNYFYVAQDKIYGVGSYISTYDLRTGELLNQVLQDASTNYVTTYFDYPYVYLMYNNTTNKLVKFNMASGKEIWRTSLDGHQGRKVKGRNGKVYVAGADGKIYIVDAQTGALLERLNAPYESEDEQLFFDNTFNFDEETDYFYCSDFKHLICYDFEK